LFEKLIDAVAKGIEHAVEDLILESIDTDGDSGSGDGSNNRRNRCIKVWLREFKHHPGGVHLIIGKQRSGKTALCYFLAQQTGRKTYAITAAKDVPPGVYVIHDPDCVPEGAVCIIDDASLFFNSMRTKKTDEEYQLLRDILVISEKQDICFIFNTHDSSLLHSTVLGQCRTLFFKEPNLMFSGTERASIKRIMQYVQQGFIKIHKTKRSSYFFLYSADCRAWGKFPLPQGWNQKVSTSVIYDAEFREIKDQNDGQRGPGTESAGQGEEENQDRGGYGEEAQEISDFEEYKKAHDVKKKKRSRKSDRSPG
jgi:hypothetical protein